MKREAAQISLPPDLLTEKPYALFEDWLPLSLCRALAADLRGLFEAGALGPARVGRDQHKTQSTEQRSDQNYWVDPQRNDDWRAFHGALEILAEELKNQLRLPIAEVEVQASVYGPGAFYRRHVDEFTQQSLGSLRSRRLLSAVYYFNVDWSGDDGGELLLWQEDRCLERVAPRENRLVLFRSDLAHEVLAPVKRPRYSVAAWFRSRS